MKVTLIDHMGDDLRVANAARVSFHKESKLVDSDVESIISQSWEEMTGQKLYEQVLSEGDQKLIKYLATHNHWTPFSHVQITLREKVPIFVARQRFKHVVGFTYNEVSRRYVDDTPEFYSPDTWRGKPINAKQGSSDEVIKEVVFKTAPTMPQRTEETEFFYRQGLMYAKWIYEKMIENGVAPEQARMVLPQSLYTEYYVTGSLAAWARAYKLRIDPHAQKEIQDLAIMWQEAISGIPGLKYSWSALTC